MNLQEFGIKALTAHPHRFRCHVLIMENPRAKGRYIVNNDIMWQKDLSAVMRKLYPERPIATFGTSRITPISRYGVYQSINSNAFCDCGSFDIVGIRNEASSSAPHAGLRLQSV